METKLELSEFKATTDITLNYKDNKPCGNIIEDSKELKIKKGDKFPVIFVRQFALNNPELIDIPRKESILQLTKEQQKKYDLDMVEIISAKEAKEPKTEKEVIDRMNPKWDMEKLNVKLAKLGSKEFKIWCEKEFGEDTIDKRKSSDKIIINILKLQDEGKL